MLYCTPKTYFWLRNFQIRLFTLAKLLRENCQIYIWQQKKLEIKFETYFGHSVTIPNVKFVVYLTSHGENGKTLSIFLVSDGKENKVG